MDRFEDIVTGLRRIYLETYLEYVLSLQFVDRLEKSRKKSYFLELTLKSSPLCYNHEDTRDREGHSSEPVLSG